LIGVAGSLEGPAAGRLRDALLVQMQGALQKVDAGVARYADMRQALKLVAVSSKAYPADPAQNKLRDTILDRKAGLDRRCSDSARLPGGRVVDPLIDKYGDFERFDGSLRICVKPGPGVQSECAGTLRGRQTASRGQTIRRGPA